MEKKRKISRCRLRSRCLIHPHYNRVLILTAHCFSPAPETWWCSPPLWHTAVREGGCVHGLCRGKLKEGVRETTQNGNELWKRLLWFCAFACGCREEKLRVQHKGRGETLMWPSATELQEVSPDPGLFSLQCVFSLLLLLPPTLLNVRASPDRQTDRGPAVMEPTGIHTAGGGGGDDGGFSGCNWL